MASPSRLQKQVVTSSIQQTDNTSVISECSIFSKTGESENGLYCFKWQKHLFDGCNYIKEDLVNNKQNFMVFWL